MDKITQNLWISDATAARRLPSDHSFDEAVTLGYFDALDYERPAASTTGDRFVIPDGPHEYTTFASAVEYVLSSLACDEQVLVHCQAGVSRSCGVCTAALAIREEITATAALEKIENARPKVNPEPEIWQSVERAVDEH